MTLKLSWFVGRKNEIALIQRIIDRLKNTETITAQTDNIYPRHFVIINGETGIGKTALSLKVLDIANENNFKTFYFSSEKGQEPYRPFIKFINRYFYVTDKLSHLDTRNIEYIITSKYPNLQPYMDDILKFLSASYAPVGLFKEDSPSFQFRIFEIVVQIFKTISKEAPLFVVFEDLQFADESTFNLIHYLARNTVNDRIIILATIRIDEPIEKKEFSFHQRFLNEVSREKLATMITLGPLNLEEITLLIEYNFPGLPDRENIAKSLENATHGNPLYISEILKEFTTKGLIKKKKEYWELSWKSDQPLPIPLSLKQIITERLSGIDPQSHDVVEYAALLGMEFRIEDLANIMNVSEETIADKIDGLIDLNIFIERENGLAFKHTIVRDIILDSMENKDQKYLQLATTFEKMYTETKDGVVFRLADSYIQSGKKEKAIMYLTLAGERAERRYAYSEAYKLYEKAVDIITSSEQLEKESVSDLLKIQLKMGNISLIIGETQKAKRHFDGVLALGYKHKTFSASAEAYYSLGNIFELQGSYDYAFSHYQKAMEMALKQANEKLVLESYASFGRVYTKIGKFKEALNCFNAALEYAKQLNEPRLIAKIYSLIGYHYVVQYQVDKSLEALNKALSIPECEEYEKLKILINLSSVSTLKNELDSAEEYLNEALKLTEKIVNLRFKGYILENIGEVKAKKGLLSDADSYYRSSLSILEKIGDKYAIATTKMDYALFMNRLGKNDDSLTLLNESLETFKTINYKQGMADAEFNIAKIISNLNQKDKAKLHLENAIQLYKEMNIESKIQEAETFLKRVTSDE